MNYTDALEQARADVQALTRSSGLFFGIFETADLVTFAASVRMTMSGTTYQRAHYAAAADQAARSFLKGQ